MVNQHRLLQNLRLPFRPEDSPRWASLSVSPPQVLLSGRASPAAVLPRPQQSQLHPTRRLGLLPRQPPQAPPALHGPALPRPVRLSGHRLPGSGVSHQAPGHAVSQVDDEIEPRPVAAWTCRGWMCFFCLHGASKIPVLTCRRDTLQFLRSERLCGGERSEHALVKGLPLIPTCAEEAWAELIYASSTLQMSSLFSDGLLIRQQD